MDALSEALERALRADVDTAGGQTALAIDMRKHASTWCRWVGELSLPLLVFVRHIVKSGGHRTLRIIAALAGFKLVAIRERKSVLARALEQINNGVALLQQCTEAGAA